MNSSTCPECQRELAEIHGVLGCLRCYSRAQMFQGALGLIVRAQLDLMREPIVVREGDRVCHS